MLVLALSVLGLVTMAPLIFISFDDPDKLRRFLTGLLRDVCHAQRIHQVQDG